MPLVLVAILGQVLVAPPNLCYWHPTSHCWAFGGCTFLVPSSVNFDSTEEGTDNFGILGLLVPLVLLISIGWCWCGFGSKDTSKVVTLPSGLTVRYG